MADRWQLRLPSIYLLILLKQWKFNMRRRSLAFACPPKLTKKIGGGGGVRLFNTVRLIGRIRYKKIIIG